MKTLTELSGTVIRMAAAAVAAARQAIPTAAPPPTPEAATAAPSVEPPTGEAPAVEPPAGESLPLEPPAGEAPESNAVKTALDEAVAKATGLSGDRLQLVRDALQAVGERTDDVRLVRVFGPEESVPGAKTVGERQYLVDRFPASMKQTAGGGREERGRRGGGGRGGGGRGGGGRGGGGAKAGTTGGFSMDSLREDRKGGGRSGGRSGGRGGGRPGGGGAPRGP
jgi:translation initiation factor IF-2